MSASHDGTVRWWNAATGDEVRCVRHDAQVYSIAVGAGGGLLFTGGDDPGLRIWRLPGGEAAQVVQADALAWLAAPPTQAFDLAFVDPPFAGGLWETALLRLQPWLAPGAWLYVEAPHEAVPALPEGWALHREGRTREVRYALYRRAPAAAATLRADPEGDGSPQPPTTE